MNNLSLFRRCAIALVTICFLAIANSNSSAHGQGHPRDFIQSTSPLKTGGSITTIQSQGQRRSWVNQPRQLVGQLRETSYNSASQTASRSFYPQGTTLGNSSQASYPYPGTAQPTAGSTSRFANNQQAQLSYERSFIGELSTGELGRTDNLDQARLPTAQASSSALPPERLAQLPSPNGTTLPLPNAALPNPVASVNGPNYVNPAQNYLNGYQGYQRGALATNSVPALNTNVRGPVARTAQANCCCGPCQPVAQVPAYQPFPTQPAYQSFGTQAAANQVPTLQQQPIQFQPNIGVPQLGGNTGSGFNSLLAGSGGYTPLLQFRNMPPGSYLGQGLIGQPTAYVDGQPIRNLLRYISP